ncbi:Histone arginine demethylase [Phytophthora palmivora]|uniref:Histone arginine demethylase n=1 Tax=Phytophthora palmivora TaxID=4796 RepID=A0A2P4XZT1_9STRA|nr:Histone arginine demethylase [Phytophthora palmivora]
MFTQPALASSAFAGFSDELIAYFTLFCEPTELLRLSEVNSVFYVFCQEDPLWMGQCLRLHNGDFSFHHNWKLTTFYPRDPRPLEQLDKAFRPVPVRGFASDFLYRRWCRCHMELGNAYLLPSEEQDPTIRRLRKIDIQDLTFQDFYEQYSRVPFIIRNAIGNWKASTEWTVKKLIDRFPNDVKHRITHNLDITSSRPTMEMSFADYFQYATNQHDETPLYIFDARFGEKMPTMLEDYNVDDLKVFKEDFLNVIASPDEEEEGQDGKKVLTKGVKLEAGGKKVRKDKKKKREPGSVRPDYRWIVVGPHRTGAPWHQDPARTSAWNSLVKGRKRWAIYPPDSPPPGVNVGKNGEYRDSGLDMPSLMWYLHVYPTLTPDQKPLEIIQEEGETIYVPNGWWHLVLNLDLTIAVTQNVVDSHNALMFMKDLLHDGQDEALEMFQHELRATRPETFDIFRLVQIPRMNGYLSEEMFQQTFRILEYWKPQLKKVINRHKILALPSGTETNHVSKKVKYPKMKSLTSRVNPTFAVGKKMLIKFFSQYNENWSEFDFEAYMTPNYESADSGFAPPSKRRKQNVLQPYELKNAMSLRYAMEDCFRIERDVYQMITESTTSNTVLQSLQTMVPRLYHSGHLLYVDEVDDDEGEGPMWRWPYIVIEYKNSGIGLDSITKKGGATLNSWKAVAAWISQEFLPKLHSVPIDPEFRGVYGHSKIEWDWYIHYLLRQRKRALSFHLIESDLPAHLMKLLENFLPAANQDAIATELLPSKSSEINPVLLHGDLTDENILGSEVNHQSDDVVMSNVESNISKHQASSMPSFLKSIGCEKYIPLLVEQEELTLESLSILDEAHLKDLGIPLGPRLAILKGRQPKISHARIIDSEDDGSDGRFDTEEEWETSSNSSSSSDEEDEGDFTTPAGLAAVEAKRKERFIGPHEWVPTSVIDFADSKTGDPLYDLVAVFFAALHCDRELWKETLTSNYWKEYIRRDKANSTSKRRCLRERFLQLVLLHPSRSVKGLFHYFPQASNFSNWEDLARGIFSDMF